jgi:UDPglucose 6-dehydrogenase
MIGVVGLGFVGLTTALGFAHKGYKVYGYDISREKAEHFRRGQVPFYEPGLDKHLKKSLQKNFFLADNLDDVINKCEVVFFCVGTPTNAKGRADLSYLKSACH